MPKPNFAPLGLETLTFVHASMRNYMRSPNTHHQSLSKGQFAEVTARFLYRAGAETTPTFRENFRFSPTTIFSAVNTQTAILVSSAQVWVSQHRIPKPPFSLDFWIYTAVFAAGGKIIVKAPVTRTAVSAPAPYENPTMMKGGVTTIACAFPCRFLFLPSLPPPPFHLELHKPHPPLPPPPYTSPCPGSQSNIYIYICCRVKNWSKISLFIS